MTQSSKQISLFPQLHNSSTNMRPHWCLTSPAGLNRTSQGFRLSLTSSLTQQCHPKKYVFSSCCQEAWGNLGIYATGEKHLLSRVVCGWKAWGLVWTQNKLQKQIIKLFLISMLSVNGRIDILSCPACVRLQNGSQASFGKIPTQQELQYYGIMSLAPDGTLNLPYSGPGLKIVQEPFIETITENKWPNALKREG